MTFADWLLSNPLWSWIVVGLAIIIVVSLFAVVVAMAIDPTRRRGDTLPQPPLDRRHTCGRVALRYRENRGIRIQEASLSSNEASCPVCHETFRNDEIIKGEIVTCRRCKALHHRTCFNYVKTCSMYACEGERYERYQETLERF